MASSQPSPRHNIDAWVVTKETFLQNASREDKDFFRKNGSPANIKKRIAELEADNTSTAGQYMKKLQPFVNGIESFDGIISPLVGLAPYGIGSVVWGSVKICLDLVTKYAKFFEAIETFLNKIGAELDRLQVLGSLYEEKTAARFSDALSDVFTKYLAFYSYVKDFMEASHTRHLREMTGLTRHPKHAMVTIAIDQVQEACDNAMKEATVAERQDRVRADEEHSEAFSRVEGQLDIVQDTQRRQTERSILENYLTWLKHINVNEIMDGLLASKNNPNAGLWLFMQEQFQDWLSWREGSTRSLWITGEPGVGKSTIAATIVKELKQRLEPSRAIAYFFCRHQNRATRTIDAILRTWIWQLLLKARGAKQPYFRLPESEWEFSSTEDASCDILCSVMRQLFEQNKETILILDGLDECIEPIDSANGSPERDDWVDFFDLLSEAPTNWKILIVSRPRTWYRSELLARLHPIEKAIKEGENTADIQSFIELRLSEIQKRQAWSEDIMQEAFDALLFNARGMFLWVTLMCFELQHLAGKHEDKIRERLKNPPRGLDDFYDRNMEAIAALHPDLADDVRTALTWILCAPRALTFDELKAGLELTPELEEMLPRLIGSFYKFEDNKVVLLHGSGREFLVSAKAGLFDSRDSDQGRLLPVHAVILKKCLQYLCSRGKGFVRVDQDQRASEERFRELFREEPFVEYACTYWYQHYAEAVRSAEHYDSVKDILDKFLTSSTSVVQWLQLFHFLRQMNRAGSDDTRQKFMHLLNRKDRIWQNLLHEHHPGFISHIGWADGGRFSRWDRFMHVRHSFDQYAEPGRWYQSPTCFSGVSIAAFFNYVDFLKTFENAELDSKGPLDGTPLLWASTADSCAALEFLLGKGCNKEAPYRNTGETPIFRSVRFPRAVQERTGTYPATLMLYKAGAKLKVFRDEKGWIDRTVLITLIEERRDLVGAQELTRAILKDDPARHREYMRRGMVLQTAAWFGRPLVLKALLEDESVKQRVNWQTQGTAPIHDGCTSNDPATVRALIEGDADVNLRSSLTTFSPLHFAVMSGGRTVPTLLEAKADLIATTWSGDIPLHIAATSTSFGDLKMLVPATGPDLKNQTGHTPLAAALSHGSFENAIRLLDLGADPEKVPDDVLQQLPLRIDHRVDTVRRRAWKPSWTTILFRGVRDCAQSYGKHLPTPLIAYIIALSGVRETLFARREGRVTVNEAITLHGGERTPYVMSPPIFGGAKQPVCRIQVKRYGKDQGFAGEGSYSFYETKTVRGKECLKWTNPEWIWGHNKHHLTEAAAHVDVRNATPQGRKHLDALRVGDRVAIVQRAHFPMWANTTEWATVTVDILSLRERWFRSERDVIWKHRRNDKGRCELGKCPRCAIERTWSDQHLLQ